MENDAGQIAQQTGQAPQSMVPPAFRLPLAILLALYLLTTTVYNLAIPIGEAPDEPAHILYVQILLKTGQFPTIPLDSPRYSYEAEQPPLYYLLQAAWMRLLWPKDTLLPDLKPNPAFSASTNFSFERHTAPNVYLHDYPPAQAVPGHLMRLLSTLFGLATLLLIWWASRLAWPADPGAALLAVGFAAFLPGFTFTSATVTNDAAAATAGAAVLLSLVYILRRGIAVLPAICAGLCVGLGILAKRSMLVTLPLLVIVPLLPSAVVRRNRNWSRLAATGAVLAVAVAIVIGAWPFVSNVPTYGDPFATAVTFQAKQELISPLAGRPGYWLSPAYQLALYNSLWGAFGIRSIDLPNALYAFYYVLCLIAIVGLIRHRQSLSSIERRVLLVCVLAFLLANAGVAYQNTQFWAVQGRLLLPGLAALALPVARGLSLVGGHIAASARSVRVALSFVLAVLVLLNWYALVQFILFVYYS